MNGYPTYPGAKMLVASNNSSEVKYEAYRVRANLNTPIEGRSYPFDTIKLDIAIELLTIGYKLSLVWLPADTGISSGFENVGWTKPTFELTNSTSQYPLGIVSPRVDMYVDEERNTYGAIVETIVPPLIFCIVSAVTFLFQMHENSAFSLRVGITTSMLITAVLFNIAQQNNLPPLTALTFYDVFIDSVISFLAISLVVNILGYVEWMRSQDKKRINELNKWGFVASIAIPLVLFIALFFLK
jgi:large-conductance mechanosensitive channel